MNRANSKFEQAILDLYNHHSPIPFQEFHRHMQEYARVLNSLKEDKPEAMELKKQFLKTTSEMPFKKVVSSEDVGIVFHEAYKKYDSCPFWFHMNNRNNGGVFSVANTLMDIDKNSLFNQIVDGVVNPPLRYNIGFGYNIFCTGLPMLLKREEITFSPEEELQLSPMSTSDLVTFVSENSPFIKARVDLAQNENYWDGACRAMLESVDVKLDYTF